MGILGGFYEGGIQEDADRLVPAWSLNPVLTHPKPLLDRTILNLWFDLLFLTFH